MITAGIHPPISIDFGKNEPGMTLQFRNDERDRIVWRDYTVDGEAVKNRKTATPHIASTILQNSE